MTSSILVVDREPTIVDLIVEILTDEGYIAYTVPDGIGGLVAIAPHPPALILLDVGSPGMHDAELIEHMREAVLATTPMVLMTTAPRAAAPLLALGAVECLAKPFDLDELLACVARYVQPAQTVKPSMYSTRCTQQQRRSVVAQGIHNHG
jgi:DNA-binding response OmpR family regulator